MRAPTLAALAALACFALAPLHAQTDIDTPSLMTTPAVLMSGQRDVSQGTGFFYGIMNPDGSPRTVFLVTNYHVVTGHNPLVPGPPAGDRLRFAVHTSGSDPSQIQMIVLPLYSKSGDPIWVSSRSFPEADVVLVPVPPAAYANAHMYVFGEPHTTADIKVRTTSETALLGYPYGFYDTVNFLPVWKTGHVASEPNVDFDGEPCFLVDVSAFPGMSGSPVLAVANGVYETLEGTMASGHMVRLLGVFSAMRVVKRVGDTGNAQDQNLGDTSLQLGYVWKAALIVDMANGYRQ